MSKKKAFVLRLPPEIYSALEKWASDEFRSVNGQMEWILNEALKKEGRHPRNNKDEKK
ncbi:Arc family DNA-binding protein [Prolixibacteraceae bacterium JC049]|nr:Arc family DNA-binding protein [Prolixibacteraceae bacterium JC049]